MRCSRGVVTFSSVTIALNNGNVLNARKQTCMAIQVKQINASINIKNTLLNVFIYSARKGFCFAFLISFESINRGKAKWMQKSQ